VKPPGTPPERSASPAPDQQTLIPPVSPSLWEAAFSPENVERALRRVERNGGAPGVDGMAVSELRTHLARAWPDIRAALDAGTYRPSPVRRVGISMVRRIGAVNTFVRGWCGYFGLADTPSVFAELDEWLRRRLRQVRWKEWKRYWTKVRNLVALGVPRHIAREWAGSRTGYSRLAGSAPLQRGMPIAYWQQHGLTGFSDSYRRVRDAWRTAGCGPACPVGWEGAGYPAPNSIPAGRPCRPDPSTEGGRARLATA
jgi:hypothetical protein